VKRYPKELSSGDTLNFQPMKLMLCKRKEYQMAKSWNIFEATTMRTLWVENPPNLAGSNFCPPGGDGFRSTGFLTKIS
jgi:hypothetical protein